MLRFISSFVFILVISQISFAQLDCNSDQIPPVVQAFENQFTLDLSAEGNLQIEAADYVFEASDNCADFSELIFSFSTDPADSVLNWICDEVVAIGIDLRLDLYAIDLAGNTSSDQVKFRILDPTSSCDLQVTERVLGGQINGVADHAPSLDSMKYSAKVPVGNVMITISDLQTCGVQPTGGYRICMTYNDAVFASDSRVHLEPVRYDHPLNGVSTLDMVVMIRHILLIQPFPNVYSYYAADVQGSGSVSAIDMVEMRQLILSQTTSFRIGKSWIFLRDEILNEALPFPNFQYNSNQPGEAYYFIDQNTDDVLNVNFTGIKIGDVNDTNAG